MVIAESNDPVVVAEELYEDANKAMGERLEWRVLEGGHDVTIRKPREIVDGICEAWEMGYVGSGVESVLKQISVDS